jgi:peptidoglycan-associated lipoprotein
MHGKFRMFLVIISLVGVLALGGCAKKRVAANSTPATPPPPPPPAPTATLTASPNTIQQGQSTQLIWNTQNATEITLDGLGTVPASGSRSVVPNASTTYILTAKGAGGSSDASARVTVNPKAAAATPPLSDEELFKQNVKDVFFDYDKYNLRTGDQQVVTADARFLQQHPAIKVLIEGHCDERGSEEYNMALGDSRASSTRDALTKLGISAGRIRTVSLGKERPFCTEANEQCFQQNRRGHLVLDR